MTLTRQRRHSARARRAAEPYREDRVAARLLLAHASGDEVTVRTSRRWSGVAVTGRVAGLDVGGHVLIEGSGSSTNVPWRMIVEVVNETPNKTMAEPGSDDYGWWERGAWKSQRYAGAS